MIKQETNVVVDIGNSRIKVAVFNNDLIVQKWILRHLSEIASLPISDERQYIFGSVRNDNQEIETLFSKESYIYLTHKTKMPIEISYLTPETLGVDRIAAAVAGNQLYPNGSLIIDLGTCITYDHVTKGGQYTGGAISPGLNMRMHAMSHFTQKLPDISATWQKIPPEEAGKSTAGCLLKGVIDGIAHEMNGFIESFRKESPTLTVIITGGDAKHFESKLKAPIFADFDLVLKGLNYILNSR